jgi:hypothetical protein
MKEIEKSVLDWNQTSFLWLFNEEGWHVLLWQRECGQDVVKIVRLVYVMSSILIDLLLS